MIARATDRRELADYVEVLRQNLDAPELQDAAARAAQTVDGGGDPAATLRAAMPPVAATRPSSGGAAAPAAPFLARDPMVSLFQSTLESGLRAEGDLPGRSRTAACSHGFATGSAGCSIRFPSAPRTSSG